MSSRAVTAKTSATPANMTIDVQLWAAGVATTSTATVMAVKVSGPRSTRNRRVGVVRRHASTGPIAVSRISMRASGTVYLSNHGGPTLALVPVMASEIS